MAISDMVGNQRVKLILSGYLIKKSIPDSLIFAGPVYWSAQAPERTPQEAGLDRGQVHGQSGGKAVYRGA